MQTTTCFNHLNHYTNLEIRIIEEKMRPGNSSSEGFISWDDKLENIYEQDLQFLENIGISCEQIADSLKGLIRKAEAIHDLSPEKIIGTKFKISGTSIKTNGYQECPFLTNNGNNCYEGRGDYKVTNLLTEESFTFSGLAIHLIESHGFFEGSTPYRINPSKVIKILDLKAGHYQKKVVKEWKWFCCDSEENNLKYEKKVTKHAKQIIVIDEFSKAYLGVPFSYYESYKYNGMSKREKLTKQYKKQNLTDQEIQNKIKADEARLKKWGLSSDFDTKIVHLPGKQYLHFINKKNRQGNLKARELLRAPQWNPIVDGAFIKENVSSQGSYIFELKESSYADIDCE